MILYKSEETKEILELATKTYPSSIYLLKYIAILSGIVESLIADNNALIQLIITKIALDEAESEDDEEINQLLENYQKNFNDLVQKNYEDGENIKWFRNSIKTINEMVKSHDVCPENLQELIDSEIASKDNTEENS